MDRPIIALGGAIWLLCGVPAFLLSRTATFRTFPAPAELAADVFLAVFGPVGLMLAYFLPRKGRPSTRPSDIVEASIPDGMDAVGGVGGLDNLS